MRRAVPVLAATAGSLALLANFHTGSPSTHVALGTTGTGGGATSSATSSSAPPTTGPASTPSTSAAPTTRTIDGPDVPNRYGDVQVRVTLSGSRIVDVQALTLPSDRQRSAEISQYAGPLLRQEVLQAQSAQINIVSGASYTSQSYAQSLQGALDSVGR
jgi:uncharacterized protein with FMN-binding domain